MWIVYKELSTEIKWLKTPVFTELKFRIKKWIFFCSTENPGYISSLNIPGVTTVFDWFNTENVI